MVVIKCTAACDGDKFARLTMDLHKQAQADGLVIMPFFCDLVAATEDSELQIIQEQTESTRVAELEKELAAAMAYISKEKDCETCKHYESVQPCPGDCACCWHVDCGCKTCHHGSNWEWRHGRESV